MPKRLSNRFDALWMAYKGGKKPKKATVTPTRSAFDGVDSASFSSDFGTGLSGFKVNPDGTKAIETSASLNPGLQGVATTATGGLQNNLSYLNQDPNQRVGFLTSGQDPLYNVLQENLRRTTDNNLGRARLTAFGTGNQNSTAGGAALGQILNNDALNQQQNLYQALQYGNQTATGNANTNLGTLGGLANLVYPLASTSNSNLLTAKQDQSQALAATAAARNAAEQQYISALNNYNSTKNAGMGSGIGSLIGGGLALAAAPFTGGASLSFLGPAMAMGGAAGGLAQGGSGPVSMGSFAPSGAFIPSQASSSPSSGWNGQVTMPTLGGTSNLYNDAYWDLGSAVA